MGGALFWGLLVVIIGVVIILNGVFRINIPIFKLLIGFFFIYLGLRIIFGSWGWMSWHSHGQGQDVVFHEQIINTPDANKKEYNVVFGKMVLDLHEVALERIPRTIDVHTVFSSTEIILNPAVPVKLVANVAFGGIQLPDRTSGGFGSTLFTTSNFNENEPYLTIRADTVFGGMNVRY